MTREELKKHCLKQVEACEKWARHNGKEPHGKIYEEHKLILELLEQELFINKPCVSEGVCREDKMQTLDKIRTEIEQIYQEIDTCSHNEYENAVEQGKEIAYENVIQIIDKYRTEVARNEEAINKLNNLKDYYNDENEDGYVGFDNEDNEALDKAIKALEQYCEDMGELSDGYHTFNQLYHQRAVLFACIVKQNKNKAWKSFKHSDGKYCFDSNGEWFIVGIDTPQGSYTYHYAKEYWDMFDCQELECGKEWDGHTEDDVTRLLSLEQQPCEDCISRAYIESIVEELENICINGDEYMLSLLSDIKNAPSVTPQPNKSENPTSWIPVTERLPKAYEFVNCTCHSLIDDREDWVIETVYIPQPSDSPYSDWGNIPMLNSGDCKVVAWVHRDIPEPYKAESEGEK